MPTDRDQLTPDNPQDWAKLQRSRGQGTGGTGYDRLPGEEAPAEFHAGDSAAEAAAGLQADDEAATGLQADDEAAAGLQADDEAAAGLQADGEAGRI